jgi:hypothetical protein
VEKEALEQQRAEAEAAEKERRAKEEEARRQATARAEAEARRQAAAAAERRRAEAEAAARAEQERLWEERRLQEEEQQRLQEEEQRRLAEQQAAEEEAQQKARAEADEKMVSEYLISHGFKGGVNDKKKSILKYQYPLHVAVKEQKPNMVKLLVEMGADKSLKNSSGRTATDKAEQYSKKRKGDGTSTSVIHALGGC